MRQRATPLPRLSSITLGLAGEEGRFSDDPGAQGPDTQYVHHAAALNTVHLQMICSLGDMLMPV